MKNVIDRDALIKSLQIRNQDPFDPNVRITRYSHGKVSQTLTLSHEEAKALKPKRMSSEGVEDSLMRVLEAKWQEIGPSVEVKTNRQAVEVTVDRAYDSMSKGQRRYLRDVGIKSLSRRLKLI